MDNQKKIDEKIRQAVRLDKKMKNTLFYGGLAFLACWLGGIVAFVLHQQDLAVILFLNGIVLDQLGTKMRNEQVEKYNNLADEINELGLQEVADTKMEYKNM